MKNALLVGLAILALTGCADTDDQVTVPQQAPTSAPAFDSSTGASPLPASASPMPSASRFPSGTPMPSAAAPMTLPSVGAYIAHTASTGYSVITLSPHRSAHRANRPRRPATHRAAGASRPNGGGTGESVGTPKGIEPDVGTVVGAPGSDDMATTDEPVDSPTGVDGTNSGGDIGLADGTALAGEPSTGGGQSSGGETTIGGSSGVNSSSGAGCTWVNSYIRKGHPVRGYWRCR
jgi:hypothetical protein